MSSFKGLLGASDEGIEPIISRPDEATTAEKAKSASCSKRDIRMKKAERAREELGLKSLPESTRLFGEFLLEMSQKTLTPRDVVKAYTITRSSVQRQNQFGRTLRPYWPDMPYSDDERIRPEDYFARMLLTPDGQTYLDEAQTGKLSKRGMAAATRLAGKFTPFTMAPTLLIEMTRYAPLIAAQTAELAEVLRSGTKQEWYGFAKDNIYGIGVAKYGFIASLLGRGDIPTADAREIDIWWENAHLFSQTTAQMLRFQKLLEKRLTEMNLKCPKELKPFYQHLAHHAIWDAVGGTHTTHADIVECMRFGYV